MNPVEDRVARALRARAEEADMSQSTLNRNYTELMNRVAADRDRRTRLVVAAAAVVILVAAGGIGLWVALDRGSTTQSVPASDAGAERAAGLLGGDFNDFRRTVTSEELSAAGMDFPTSQGRLEIVRDKVTATFGTGQGAINTVTVLEDGTWQIITPQPERDFVCTDPGTYRASLTGDVLTLRAISDSCALRAAVLEGSWTRR